MEARVLLCDICYADGKVRLATSRYWNDEDKEFECCPTHLKQVKEADLQHEELGDAQFQAVE